MSKFLKGDLLIFTNKGLVRIDNLNRDEHLVLAINNEGYYYYEEIDEISKTFKNKYSLNKISFNNNIDSYLVNDNINIKSIQNIPTSIETSEIAEYLNYNESRCKSNSKIGELSSFDFIAFPTIINVSNDDSNDDSNDYYRFQGLYLSSNEFSSEVINNKDTIEFIKNYLNLKGIQFDISINESKNTAKITINNTNNKIIKLSLYQLLGNITKEQLLIFTKSLIELTNELNINDKNNYYIIKYAYLLLGVNISSYYKDNVIQIRIPKKISDCYYYYFNYDLHIYNKIRNIKKVYIKGFLYSLKLKNNNFFLTDLGFIS